MKKNVGKTFYKTLFRKRSLEKIYGEVFTEKNYGKKLWKSLLRKTEVVAESGSGDNGGTEVVETEGRDPKLVPNKAFEF